MEKLKTMADLQRIKERVISKTGVYESSISNEEIV